jgi:hypothetical protein
MITNRSAIRKVGDRACNPGHPLPQKECRLGTSRRSNRFCSHSSTSASTHPTRLGPRFTRLGNCPALSNRAMCCGEYRTNSLSWRFDRILITMFPWREHRDAPVTTNPEVGSRYQDRGESPNSDHRLRRPFQTGQLSTRRADDIDALHVR